MLVWRQRKWISIWYLFLAWGKIDLVTFIHTLSSFSWIPTNCLAEYDLRVYFKAVPETWRNFCFHFSKSYCVRVDSSNKKKKEARSSQMFFILCVENYSVLDVFFFSSHPWKCIAMRTILTVLLFTSCVVSCEYDQHAEIVNYNNVHSQHILFDATTAWVVAMKTAMNRMTYRQRWVA